MRTILQFITPVILAGFIGTGCATKMAPEGVYNSDSVLYNADLAITTSYDVIQTFVIWEYSHRDILLQYPEIKSTADKIRREAPGIINSAMSIRDQYAKEPNVDNRLALGNILTLLRKTAFEATRQLIENQSKTHG